jgi:proteinaceous RNase P
MLVSNDELRDHIWAMLRPKHFLRWKVRHIASYSFPGAAQLQPPLPFTPCVQQLPGSGAWMVPAAERAGEWMMVAPVAEAGWAAAGHE